MLIKGKVKHSYSANLPPLQAWFIVKHDGAVLCGHCTCMAGLAETCSHVGALLYWVDAAVRMRDDTTSTSKPNKWMMPSPVSQIPYLPLSEIKTFSSTQHEAQPSSSKKICIRPSTEELKTFYGELSSCSKKPIVLSLSLDHNQSFVHASNHLPTPLQSLYDPDNLDLGYEELLSKSEQFGEDVTSKMCCRLALSLAICCRNYNDGNESL